MWYGGLARLTANLLCRSYLTHRRFSGPPGTLKQKALSWNGVELNSLALFWQCVPARITEKKAPVW